MPESRRRRSWARRSGAHLTGADPPAGDRACPPGGDGAGPAPEHPFAVAGERRYVEVAELGRGGMGQVVAAVDLRLRRQVALKRVAAAVTDRAAASRRFAREAWITAGLDHPAIVPVFDAGVGQDGELYYTMRLVRGRTLGAAIGEARGPGGRLALLRHFLGACEAVAYAHSQGVVHRDLKPDNILVADFGETQVVDWGVARHLDADEERFGPALPDPLLTSAGAIVGTPAYMSPEQARGAPPDARADVYSLGAVLHEIVAGRPLRGDDGASASSPAPPAAGSPPPPAPPPDAPPELAAIMEHALRPDPAARYPDARALAADVTRYLDGRRVSAHRYSPLEGLRRWARRRRAALAVAAVAAVLLFGVGAWALLRTRVERDRALLAEREARAALAAADQHLGRSLVEQALTAQAIDAQPEAEVLAAHALTLAESPEARGVLAAFAFAGRPLLRERLDLPRCDAVEPGPGGAVLCAGGDHLEVLEGRPLQRRWRVARPASGAMWLAGGRLVAAIDADGHGWLLDARDGALRADLGGGMAWQSFSHPEGGDLAAVMNSQWLTIIDGPRAATRRAAPCPDRLGILTVSIGAGGSRVVVTCRGGLVALLDREGALQGRVQTATADGADLATAALSPDGRLLVAASMTGQLQGYDARSGAALAGRRTQLGVVRKAAFSPGGEAVALVGDRGGVSIWAPASWALLRRLPADRDQSLRWAADGRELETAGPRLRRWALPVGQPAIRLMEPRPPGLASAELSPGGDRLLVAAGDGSLGVIDTRDGRRVLADRFQPDVLKGASFLPDGGILAWAAGRPSLRRYDAAGRVVETRDLGGLKRAALLPGGWLVAAPYLLELQLLPPPAAGAPPAPLRLGDQLILDADQSADGRVVVLVDAAGGLWWVEDGAPPRARRLAAHPGARAVALSGDGAVVAVLDRRGVEVLDAATGAVRARCVADGRLFFDVALSPAGDLVAAGDADRQARVWSAADGRLLGVLGGHEARVAGVRFALGGRALVTASWDGSARVFGLGALTRPAAALRAEAEAAWGLTLGDASAAPLR